MNLGRLNFLCVAITSAAAATTRVAATAAVIALGAEKKHLEIYIFGITIFFTTAEL